MATFDLSTARRLTLTALADLCAGAEPIGTGDIKRAVLDLWQREGGVTPPDASRIWSGDDNIHEVLWDLIVQRVLTIRDLGGHGWDALALTDYGRGVIREQRWSPYDPDGYARELHEQAPALASLCQLYAEEALQCFRTGCYLAAVVMLGAASEGIVNELFRRFVNALKAGGIPEAPSVEGKIEKEQSVYRRYEVFRKHFDSLVMPKLPSELSDDLNLQFDGVFNLIRFYRNDAGHPTGTRIERMSAFTSLVLFVPHCKRVEDLINWLETNSGTLSK
jgi:hypothetical protein